MTPRVSVVVPTRNRLGLLQRALASIEAQQFRDFEIVVVDDGSEDGTAAWLRAQPQVQALTMARPVGAAAARNRAVRKARGQLIAFLDDDDLWRPSYLGTQVETLDADPTAALSYADHLEIDPSGRAAQPDTRPLFAYGSPLVRLLSGCFIHTLSVVACRREAFDRYGAFDESLAVVHDLEWYARILASGGTIAHLSQTLVGRSIPGGLVSSHRRWYWEERGMLARLFAADPARRSSQRMITAHRSLYFARAAFGKGDWTFGLARLLDGFLAAPHWSAAIAARRWRRRIDVGTPVPSWDAAALSPR